MSASSPVQRVHSALFPTAGPTTLHVLPGLADELGVQAVYVKDESARYGLPAFKILGASYALASVLGSRWGVEPWDVSALREHAARDPVTVFAATDGNHGRATAHTARLLGLPAHIYVPRTVEAWSVKAIESEGCPVTQVDADYDGAVRAVADAASAADGVLIQDMSWDGYVDIPELITQGYMTITSEIDSQLPQGTQATAVVVPVGVGSLAHAVVQWYNGRVSSPALSKAANVRILSAEPEAAPCLATSLASGRDTPTSVETSFTVMPGLNCGTVNPEAWPDLKRAIKADDALVVSDDEALAEVAVLGGLGVPAGPCGAAALAAARKARLRADDVLVLICTEGVAGSA
ncbi:hypothetical protein VHUM_03031 [Vanrija humicola]|uniref:Tryptophan synthase beta chain-like PALP domain-containing protein n=1 Tax=Vanrija humicola TaxID=5417 RepID=A0A7D8Z335_VANHU|nr:hypothetical protein VHUM_03031 [Vanrija humicola]